MNGHPDTIILVLKGKCFPRKKIKVANRVTKARNPCKGTETIQQRKFRMTILEHKQRKAKILIHNFIKASTLIHWKQETMALHPLKEDRRLQRKNPEDLSDPTIQHTHELRIYKDTYSASNLESVNNV